MSAPARGARQWVYLVIIGLQLLYQAYEFHRFSVHYEGLTLINQTVLERCESWGHAQL